MKGAFEHVPKSCSVVTKSKTKLKSLCRQDTNFMEFGNLLFETPLGSS